MHVSKKIDELDIPSEVMPSVCAQLEKLVVENKITMEMVNKTSKTIYILNGKN